MIRVLIAEDEPAIARALAHMIQQHPAFEIAGMETDGQKALDRLETEPVDVVFTDIQMPVMNGLDLLRHIHDGYPHVYTVILTGYQMFSYAKIAIEYQAFDFLLKPVSRDGLLTLLNKLEVACEVRRKQRLRSRLFGAGRGGAGDLPGEANQYVILFCAGALPEAGVDLLTPGEVFWSEVGLERIMEEELGGCPLSFFRGKHGSEKIAVIEPDSPKDMEQIIHRIYDRLVSSGTVAVTMVGHSVPVSLSDMGEIIRQLRFIMYQEVRLCAPKLIWNDCMRFVSTRNVMPQESMPVEWIVMAVCAQSRAAIEKTVSEALRAAAREDYTQLDIMRFLVAIINDSRLTSSMNTREYTAIKLELDKAVYNASDIDGLGRDITEVLYSLCGDPGGKKDIQKTMDEVEAFLIENYDKAISTNLLSQKFGFVPSYLSKMFRVYKNVSPSEFLTRYRINRAKDIMSEHPEIMVRDIASLVGYSDQHYFSKIFKREAGIWPTEYQKSLKPEKEEMLV